MNQRRDPIVAIATPLGRAGIGVIRVSGKNLQTFAQEIFSISLSPRQARLVAIKDAGGDQIDQGLALFFPAPHSFTGEDVLEFQGHGGEVVLDIVMKRLLHQGERLGLRIANPGEFSERAFLNDKIDLAQAEAIADLIEASSEAAVKSANRSLVGLFSKEVNELTQAITQLRILVEATLDFPEEEIDFLETSNAQIMWLKIKKRIDGTLKASQQGAILRKGANLVLAGAPNVGKSSLLNAITGLEVAIVTSIPGTTRDRLKEQILIEGIPFNIIDTAGLRDTSDEIESIGILRSWEAIQSADVIIFMRSTENEDDPETQKLYQELKTKTQNIPMIEVWNKLDLAPQFNTSSGILISAKTQEGIEELKREILKKVGWEGGQENVILARERQIKALYQAQHHVLTAGTFLEQGNQNLELLAEELRLAQESLGEITGKLLADDLLGKIFSSFCIGK